MSERVRKTEGGRKGERVRAPPARTRRISIRKTSAGRQVAVIGEPPPPPPPPVPNTPALCPHLLPPYRYQNCVCGPAHTHACARAHTQNAHNSNTWAPACGAALCCSCLLRPLPRISSASVYPYNHSNHAIVQLSTVTIQLYGHSTHWRSDLRELLV